MKIEGKESEKRMEKIYKLRKRGMTAQEMSEFFGTDIQTVKNCIDSIYSSEELASTEVSKRTKKRVYSIEIVVATGIRINTPEGSWIRRKATLSFIDSLSKAVRSNKNGTEVKESKTLAFGEKKQINFFDAFDNFIHRKKVSESRNKYMRTLKIALLRFELYRRESNFSDYRLKLNQMTIDDIVEFESFLSREHQLYIDYPEIYQKIVTIAGYLRKPHAPQPRGENTIIGLMALLRSFFRWCRTYDLTSNDPFAKYGTKKSQRYGTPYYLTLEERDLIADADPSADIYLETQRDIFIFQCLIGCRVSDLMKLTASNVIGDCIEYIPVKTKAVHPEVVKVPMNSRAKNIVKKYMRSDHPQLPLLPFIPPQKYNVAIRILLSQCGITRLVTVINPKTGEDERRPLDQVASSHLARRTFIGNLYKKVKDPSLICALSGHSEGSRAFARYRDIDMEMKKELISLLD